MGPLHPTFGHTAGPQGDFFRGARSTAGIQELDGENPGREAHDPKARLLGPEIAPIGAISAPNRGRGRDAHNGPRGQVSGAQ